MNDSRQQKKLRVCFFGNYDASYIRTMVILRGLRESGYTVYECNDQRRGLHSYVSLIRQHKKIKGEYDVLVVGNAGISRTYVLLAKFLTRKPVIWDAHFSVYDAYVYDRGLVTKWSAKGLYHWCMDWLATKMADFVYLDTRAHAQYFAQLFHADIKKFFVVYVGADDHMFVPRPVRTHDTDKFIVEFHGKYIPLQGVQYIIHAAKLLQDEPDIHFILIGNGQTFKENKHLATKLELTNVTFVNKVPYADIPKYVADADVCLGIFGDTNKTQRVIPNKLYEAVAMGKPVITARTPAITEIFTDREDIILCAAANPKDLACAIRELRNNGDLTQRMAKNAGKLFAEELTPSAVVESLSIHIREFIH